MGLALGVQRRFEWCCRCRMRRHWCLARWLTACTPLHSPQLGDGFGGGLLEVAKLALQREDALCHGHALPPLLRNLRLQGLLAAAQRRGARLECTIKAQLDRA